MKREEMMSDLISDILEVILVFSAKNTELTIGDGIISQVEASAFSAVHAGVTREDFVNISGQAFDLMNNQKEGFKNVQ